MKLTKNYTADHKNLYIYVTNNKNEIEVHFAVNNKILFSCFNI